MKLLLCKNCAQVFSLVKERIKTCDCGQTKGAYYKDGYHAWYSGDKATPLGFHNLSLMYAIQARPETGDGRIYDAFVIPVKCNTFKLKNK